MAIIIGYQGIGKSTISNINSGFIDLESSNFWIDGVRDENWFKVYCNIAINLSSQNYYVFISSHKVIREYLIHLKNTGLHDEIMCIVCPSLDLKNQWIEKLQQRYDRTGLDKDYKALMNAKEMYTENITDLLNEKGFKKIVLTCTEYILGDAIRRNIGD